MLKKSRICKIGSKNQISSLYYKINKRFSFIYPNFPCQSKYFINGDLLILDTNLNLYNNKFIDSFLEKRWTLKQEIRMIFYN